MTAPIIRRLPRPDPWDPVALAIIHAAIDRATGREIGRQLKAS